MCVLTSHTTQPQPISSAKPAMAMYWHYGHCQSDSAKDPSSVTNINKNTEKQLMSPA